MTIFVGGVHGAGKTFLAKPACENLGLVHATASQLIRSERGHASWADDKTVSDVEHNQRALINAVRRVRENGGQLVLDGHFVLRKDIGVHERLEASVFADLECRSVLLVQCDAAAVLERLLLRDGGTNWSIQEVGAFIQAEAAHGALVADRLGVAFVLLTNPTAEEFEAHLLKQSEAHSAKPKKRSLLL